MNSVTRSEIHHELALLQSANQIVLVKISLLNGVLRKSGISCEDPMELTHELYDVTRCHLCRLYYDKKLAYLQSRINSCTEKLKLLPEDMNIECTVGGEGEDTDYVDILANLSLDIEPHHISPQISPHFSPNRPKSIELPFPPHLPLSSPKNSQDQPILTSPNKPPQPPPPPPRLSSTSQSLSIPVSVSVESNQNNTNIANNNTNGDKNNTNITIKDEGVVVVVKKDSFKNQRIE